jgi:crossover junction endodeoxyribonuclease RuvC
MRSRLILGIDPGFGRMGFGCVSVARGKAQALDFGVVTTPADDAMGDRLLALHDDLVQLVSQLRPDTIAVEKLFFAKNTTTALRVAESRGVVLLIAAQAGIPVIEATPAQVKLAVTGDGSADKAGMQRMVARLLGLPRVPKPDDAADALAVAITVSTML